MKTLRLVFLGDIVGRVGRKAVAKELPGIQSDYSPDVVIANGENSAGGFGIQPDTAQEIFRAGVHLITTGNHIWSKREIYPYLENHKDTILRPLNFPEGAPGVGALEYPLEGGGTLLLVNLIGRVFMPDLVDCPFEKMDALLAKQDSKETRPLIFCDFHAEATSEKVAFGHYVDGRVSVFVGTHTHVQTADDRVLPGGTAYISDAGMCGPEEGVLGCEKEPIIEKFRTGRPHRFDVAKGPAIVNGIFVEVDRESGKALRIERIFRRVPVV